jgi:hypothetical protein
MRSSTDTVANLLRRAPSALGRFRPCYPSGARDAPQQAEQPEVTRAHAGARRGSAARGAAAVELTEVLAPTCVAIERDDAVGIVAAASERGHQECAGPTAAARRLGSPRREPWPRSPPTRRADGTSAGPAAWQVLVCPDIGIFRRAPWRFPTGFQPIEAEVVCPECGHHFARQTTLGSQVSAVGEGHPTD